MPVNMMRRSVTMLTGALLSSASPSHTLAAQSAGEVAGWDGLMLSPIGALPPLARTPIAGDSVRYLLSARYGRWRYDLDDAIHNNLGVTLSRRLGATSTQVELTGAYLALSCGACSAWLSGGLDLQSTLWHQDFPGDSLVRTETGIFGLRGSLGAARYLGDGHAIATSAAAAAVIGVDLRFARESHLSVTVTPGYGIGRIVSVDESAYGTRPTFGAAAAWKFRSGPAFTIGMERIFIEDGPIQIGSAFSWRIR
jgi:hypothetical protein